MFYFGADEWYTSFKGYISDVRFFYDLSFLTDGIFPNYLIFLKKEVKMLYYAQ